jgi:hypothetical protein
MKKLKLEKNTNFDGALPLEQETIKKEDSGTK